MTFKSFRICVESIPFIYSETLIDVYASQNNCFEIPRWNSILSSPSNQIHFHTQTQTQKIPRSNSSSFSHTNNCSYHKHSTHIFQIKSICETYFPSSLRSRCPHSSCEAYTYIHNCQTPGQSIYLTIRFNRAQWINNKTLRQKSISIAVNQEAKQNNKQKTISVFAHEIIVSLKYQSHESALSSSGCADRSIRILFFSRVLFPKRKTHRNGIALVLRRMHRPPPPPSSSRCEL